NLGRFTLLCSNLLNLEKLSFTMYPDSAPETSNVEVLDTQHRQAFERALARVLETEVAEQTFAQIIDGLPTRRSFSEFNPLPDAHPTRAHTELCPGMVERARTFRSEFKLLDAFSLAAFGSKTFHLRLLELLAVSCHQIAVYLYSLDGVNHTHEEYQRWANEPRDMNRLDSHRDPTPFCHGSYIDIDRYPNGAADAAGYWAEAKIFGGVLVFDRGESEVECKELYLHAGLLSGPYTLFPLTTEQFQSLLDFLLRDDSGTKKPENPLPLRATSRNKWRWSEWDAIALHHIFRDKYERSFSPSRPRPDYRSSMDWPEIADDLYLINEMHNHRNGEPIDKERIRTALENLKQITPSSPCWPDGPLRHAWTNVLFEETTNGSDHTTDQA
ncbi:hypothetical protein LB507_011069, partial [Fusarium sp. FIESC RH6]